MRPNRQAKTALACKGDTSDEAEDQQEHGDSGTDEGHAIGAQVVERSRCDEQDEKDQARKHEGAKQEDDEGHVDHEGCTDGPPHR